MNDVRQRIIKELMSFEAEYTESLAHQFMIENNLKAKDIIMNVQDTGGGKQIWFTKKPRKPNWFQRLLQTNKREG